MDGISEAETSVPVVVNSAQIEKSDICVDEDESHIDEIL